jgi:hypothetical protein
MNQLFEGRGQTLSSFCTDTIIRFKIEKKIKVNKRRNYSLERSENGQFW